MAQGGPTPVLHTRVQARWWGWKERVRESTHKESTCHPRGGVWESVVQQEKWRKREGNEEYRSRRQREGCKKRRKREGGEEERRNGESSERD